MTIDYEQLALLIGAIGTILAIFFGIRYRAVKDTMLEIVDDFSEVMIMVLAYNKKPDPVLMMSMVQKVQEIWGHMKELAPEIRALLECKERDTCIA